MLHSRNVTFFQKEDDESNCFKCKDSITLNANNHIRFNGSTIKKGGSELSMTDDRQFNNLKLLNPQIFTNAEFISQHARGANIAVIYGPDSTFAFAHSAQAIKLIKEEAKNLNDAIDTALLTKDRHLRFIPLETESIFVAVFIDASFVSNSDSSSQNCVFIICLIDQYSRCKIIHYCSFKSKRIACSALEAELFLSVNGFDHSSIMRLAAHNIFGKHVPLILFTNSKNKAFTTAFLV